MFSPGEIGGKWALSVEYEFLQPFGKVTWQ